MATSQQHFKKDYDHQVRVTAMLQPGGWIFINMKPLATASVMDVTQAALGSYSKLIAKSLGPFHVKAICLHLLVINEHAIYNVVSTDSAARLLHTEHPTLTNNNSVRKKGKGNPKESPQTAQCKLNTTRAKGVKQGNGTTEHTV